MKKYLLFMAAIMMAVCCMTLVSCGDEELEPDGGSSSSGGNGEAPKAVKAVDLGLPSGTLWATMNIGASSPEDYGDYFGLSGRLVGDERKKLVSLQHGFDT